eukprot:TRINITY_DN704_c0_g2_i1.p3 TRINITY_DN704_c0_g2~~TRINITY_DN704_c0_g2_i1.p3  ORF type:complete len:106 (+),score=21.75 TRINITY_DN704_c0_g2_i1:130-447(+)
MKIAWLVAIFIAFALVCSNSQGVTCSGAKAMAANIKRSMEVNPSQRASYEEHLLSVEEDIKALCSSKGGKNQSGKRMEQLSKPTPKREEAHQNKQPLEGDQSRQS